MDDDQFDRLLDAISSPLDTWLTIGIAVISLAAGFGLGILTDFIGRKRGASESREAERMQIAHDTSAWGFRLAGAGAPIFVETLKEWSAESGMILVRLRAHDASDEVGGWYLRRITMLCKPPEGGRWTDSDFAKRTALAISISNGMLEWARRDKPESEYVVAKDAEWFRHGGFDVPDEGIDPEILTSDDPHR